jgi:UDP-3-O-[3-hydroxymyristoyl] glucosamine N-acyltransferase
MGDMDAPLSLQLPVVVEGPATVDSSCVRIALSIQESAIISNRAAVGDCTFVVKGAIVRSLGKGARILERSEIAEDSRIIDGGVIVQGAGGLDGEARTMTDINYTVVCDSAIVD